jgi:hypothetical protein
VQKIAQILEVSFEQLLNFDPKQIFKDPKNMGEEKASHSSDFKISPINEYREKYIQLLENELERLRKLEK